MIKVIVVDDEQHCIDRLQSLLVTKFSDIIELAGIANSVITAYDLINQHKPNLVFLDVQLNDLTGFDLLSKYNDPKFDVIFTTAFEQYAIRAFKFSAIDYLLKPVDSEELGLAIRKVNSSFEQKKSKR